jgi:SAM-dependent methyltransferase
MELPHIWQPASRIDVSQALRQWFKSELGRELLAAEDRLLGHILPDLFGYHALQLGQIVPCHLLHASRIRHRIVADKQLLTVEGLSSLPALPEQLPLAANSMDVVVLQHLLDVTVNPHAVLREAARVLIPEGHLVIIGFNPWSLWGFWRFCRLPWSDTPWLKRDLSPQRLTDWLALLDFDIVGVESAYFIPPIETTAVRQRFSWLEALGLRYWSQGGAAYAVLARKRVACLTPLRLRQPFLQLLRPPLVTESRDSNSDL